MDGGASPPPPLHDFMDHGRAEPGRFGGVPDLQPSQHLLLITSKSEPLKGWWWCWGGGFLSDILLTPERRASGGRLHIIRVIIRRK